MLEADPVDFFRSVNLGRVRSQGVEFDLSGGPIDGFSLGVSYAYTDTVLRGNENPALPDGTRLRNVPRHAASLQASGCLYNR